MSKSQYTVGFFQNVGSPDGRKKFVNLGQQMAGTASRAVYLFRNKNISLKPEGIPINMVKLVALTDFALAQVMKGGVL